MKQLSIVESFKRAACTPTHDHDTTRVVSIDVGIHNMGVCEMEIGGDGTLRFIWADRIDITRHGCRGVADGCTLHHSNMMVDWVGHLVKRLRCRTDRCDVVLVERQPPLGFRCCEQLLCAAYRDKVVLVQPRALHSFFYVGSMDYDTRKQRMVEVALHRLRGMEGGAAGLACLSTQSRAHDIADSILMVIWFASVAHGNSKRGGHTQQQIHNKNKHLFDTFLYNPRVKPRAL